MPQSIPPGLTAEQVVQAISDLDGGIDHPFAEATRYELIHGDKRYPPKAVVGLAFRYVLGRVLQPNEFSSGVAPGQAVYVLRKLGFNVINKDDAADDEKPVPKDWSENEVKLIVADYFAMLEHELLGKEYSKAEHRRSLAPNLSGRSNASIEFKHANVSGVLVELGLPYIEGYKPRSNYQALLAQEVEAFLDDHANFMEQLADAPTINPVAAPIAMSLDLEQIVEDPPTQIVGPKEHGKPWLSRKGKKIDFAQRDALNRQLAKLGEQFVVDVEKHRLQLAGRDDLSRRVQWVAAEIGDGLGFDVLSFDDLDESEKLIEVKTTGLGKFFPFFVTGNEVRCSEDMAEKFHLFRVFDFSRVPRLFILTGSLTANCQLEPTQFRATLSS